MRAVTEPSAQPQAPVRPVTLTFGLKPERFLGSESRIDAFIEPPTREQTEIVVEAVTSGIDAGGHVCAIVPDWLEPSALVRLEMVRAALDTDRLSIHRTPLPPLAAAVLASFASAIAPHVPGPGMLVSLLPRIEAELHVFTWLGSVKGLTTPQPSFGQHVGSFTPGAAFGVSSWPQPSVHRIQAGTPSVPLPSLTRASRLVVADHGGDTGWITGPVNTALGRLPTHKVDPTPRGPKWWGTSKLVESVAYPVDVPQLAADLTASLDPWVCRWCRELIAVTPCPVCGHRGRPRSRAPRPTAAPG